jgi:very-short-patch-repair endonuclease
MADQRARALRQNLTDAERMLWSSLRLLRARGLHFRRQVPFGRYIADFACHSARIIIELDGSQHAEPRSARRDVERTKFLSGRGYRVLRFWNLEVVRNRNGVVETILAAAYHPHPKFARATSRTEHASRDEMALANFDLPARGR